MLVVALIEKVSNPHSKGEHGSIAFFTGDVKVADSESCLSFGEFILVIILFCLKLDCVSTLLNTKPFYHKMNGSQVFIWPQNPAYHGVEESVHLSVLSCSQAGNDLQLEAVVKGDVGGTGCNCLGNGVIYTEVALIIYSNVLEKLEMVAREIRNFLYCLWIWRKNSVRHGGS